jgi:hypothetical protein
LLLLLLLLLVRRLAGVRKGEAAAVGGKGDAFQLPGRKRKYKN